MGKKKSKVVEVAKPAKVLSMRLTNAMKFNVVAKVCQKKYEVLQEKVREGCRQLARDIYAEQVSEWSAKTMKSMDEGFFMEGSEVRVFLAGKEFRQSLGEKRRIPWKLAPNWEVREAAVHYEPGHRFDVRFGKLDLAKHRLDEERNRLAQTCRSVLDSVTTTAKLREVWPEVDEFLPREYVQEPPCTAIVVRVDTLRELLKK